MMSEGGRDAAVVLRPGNMRKALRAAGAGAALALLLASPCVGAEAWKLFALADSGERNLIDIAGVERGNDVFLATYRTELAREESSRLGSGTVVAIQKRMAVSCGRQAVAMVELRELDAEGKVAGRAVIPAEGWNFVVPASGSVDYRFRQLVCRVYAETAQRTPQPAAENKEAAPPGKPQQEAKLSGAEAAPPSGR